MSIQLRYVEQRIETLRKLLAEDDGETLVRLIGSVMIPS